jgi:hypothetical protein
MDDQSPQKVSRHDSHLPSSFSFDGNSAAGDGCDDAAPALSNAVTGTDRTRVWPDVTAFASRSLGKPPVPPA